MVHFAEKQRNANQNTVPFLSSKVTKIELDDLLSTGKMVKWAHSSLRVAVSMGTFLKTAVAGFMFFDSRVPPLGIYPKE